MINVSGKQTKIQVQNGCIGGNGWKCPKEGRDWWDICTLRWLKRCTDNLGENSTTQQEFSNEPTYQQVCL